MILLASILFYLVLVALNYKLLKSLLYPPVIFSFVWFFCLIGLLVSGNSLFSISTETVMVYVIGGLFFSCGGLAYFFLYGTKGNKKNDVDLEKNNNLKLYFDVILVIFIVGSIFYVRQFSEDFGDPLFFAKQRQIEVEASGVTREFSFLRNTIILGYFLLVTLQIHNKGLLFKNWRYCLVFITTVVAGSLTGSKGIIIHLTLVAFFLSSIKNNRINLKLLVTTLIAGLLSFCIGLLLVSYEYATSNQNYIKLLVDNANYIIETVQAYWLGGLVAFDKVVENPNYLESTQNIFRAFVEFANNFGANYDIPSLHAGFTCISISQCGANTYTIYFSYFKDYGWMGIIIGLFIYGFIMSWIYRLATQRKIIFMALYAISMDGLFFSFHAEHFFLNLNFMVKMLILFYLTYYVIKRIKFRYWRNSVSAQTWK